METITVVIAVDNEHLDELQKTLPTWVEHKDFKKYPFLVIYDADQVALTDPRFDILKDFNANYVKWSDPDKIYNTQREKMLTALTVLPGLYVKTPWYLKIDTDCTATNNDKWYDESWLKKDYVFITNPWGYTKPANSIELLDNWADDYFDGTYKPLNLPYNPEDNKVKHKRIISWLFLCKTEWSYEVAHNFIQNEDKPDDPVIFKLPSISDKEYKVSQDTILWYMAAIQKDKYKLFNFKDKGWKHGRV